MSTVRVAIAGVGNCASSLVQGVEYYRDADPDDIVPGLMHVTLGGYHVRRRRVRGRLRRRRHQGGCRPVQGHLRRATTTPSFATGRPSRRDRAAGPDLRRARARTTATIVEESPAEPVDVAAGAARRRRRRARELPAGGLGGGAAPLRPGVSRRRRGLRERHPGVHRQRSRPGPRRFRDAGVPIVGDDIKSQVGSTIVHRVLTRLFEDRGLALDRTYQLNFGGNMDFKNMLERKRLESKKISKTQAVTSQVENYVLDADDVHIGPSDHVPWLNDRKWAYIRMEGRNFGDVPLNLELKLEVWDSPNSAGVIIDAVRCAKVALDRGIGGPLVGPSAYFMKSPPVQYHDDEAHRMVEAFAAGEPAPVWPED